MVRILLPADLSLRKRELTDIPSAILIAYSTKPERHLYLPLLIQQALIIVAIWLCWGRNQLSLSDIEFAITQTRSPVSIYALVFVIPRLFLEKSAFKKGYLNDDGQPFFRRGFTSRDLDWPLIKHRICGLLYGLCCLSLDLVHKFDKAGYTHFTQNHGSTDPSADPLTPPSSSRLEGRPNFKAWLGLAIFSVLIYECVLHRRGQQRRGVMHQLAGEQFVPAFDRQTHTMKINIGTRKKLFTTWPLNKQVRYVHFHSIRLPHLRLIAAM